MESLLDKIKSRGYWAVEIRPVKYAQARVEYSELLRILEKTQVDLRGWDVPHIDPNAQVQRDTSWISQESEWNHLLESWRFYQSGQFVDFVGIWDDWLDQTQLTSKPADWKWGKRLGIASTLFYYTEVLEFASRLSLSDAGDDAMHISITLHGIGNRKLWVEDHGRTPLRYERSTAMDSFPFEAEIPRARLVAEARELALQAAASLFQRFDYTPGIDLLRDWQSRIDKW